MATSWSALAGLAIFRMAVSGRADTAPRRGAASTPPPPASPADEPPGDPGP